MKDLNGHEYHVRTWQVGIRATSWIDLRIKIANFMAGSAPEDPMMHAVHQIKITTRHPGHAPDQAEANSEPTPQPSRHTWDRTELSAMIATTHDLVGECDRCHGVNQNLWSDPRTEGAGDFDYCHYCWTLLLLRLPQ